MPPKTKTNNHDNFRHSSRQSPILSSTSILDVTHIADKKSNRSRTEHNKIELQQKKKKKKSFMKRFFRLSSKKSGKGRGDHDVTFNDKPINSMELLDIPKEGIREAIAYINSQCSSSNITSRDHSQKEQHVGNLLPSPLFEPSSLSPSKSSTQPNMLYRTLVNQDEVDSCKGVIFKWREHDGEDRHRNSDNGIGKNDDVTKLNVYSVHVVSEAIISTLKRCHPLIPISLFDNFMELSNREELVSLLQSHEWENDSNSELFCELMYHLNFAAHLDNICKSDETKNSTREISNNNKDSAYHNVIITTSIGDETFQDFGHIFADILLRDLLPLGESSNTKRNLTQAKARRVAMIIRMFPYDYYSENKSDISLLHINGQCESNFGNTATMIAADGCSEKKGTLQTNTTWNTSSKVHYHSNGEKKVDCIGDNCVNNTHIFKGEEEDMFRHLIEVSWNTNKAPKNDNVIETEFSCFGSISGIDMKTNSAIVRYRNNHGAEKALKCYSGPWTTKLKTELVQKSHSSALGSKSKKQIGDINIFEANNESDVFCPINNNVKDDGRIVCTHSNTATSKQPTHNKPDKNNVNKMTHFLGRQATSIQRARIRIEEVDAVLNEAQSRIRQIKDDEELDNVKERLRNVNSLTWRDPLSHDDTFLDSNQMK